MPLLFTANVRHAYCVECVAATVLVNYCCVLLNHNNDCRKLYGNVGWQNQKYKCFGLKNALS